MRTYLSATAIVEAETEPGGHWQTIAEFRTCDDAELFARAYHRTHNRHCRAMLLDWCTGDVKQPFWHSEVDE